MIPKEAKLPFKYKLYLQVTKSLFSLDYDARDVDLVRNRKGDRQTNRQTEGKYVYQ